jgi:multicomponent Na+:H+ antiporter subunit G
MILDLVSIILIGFGLLFFLGAAAGILRFPDFYTRMHAAGKGDTLSSLLIILGFAIHEFRHFDGMDFVLMLKMLSISAFIMITSPASTHALIDAGYEDGIDPIVDPEGGDALAELAKKDSNPRP